MNIPDGWLGYTPWCIGDHDRSQFCNQWDEIDEIVWTYFIFDFLEHEIVHLESWQHFSLLKSAWLPTSRIIFWASSGCSNGLPDHCPGSSCVVLGTSLCWGRQIQPLGDWLMAWDGIQPECSVSAISTFITWPTWTAWPTTSNMVLGETPLGN